MFRQAVLLATLVGWATVTEAAQGILNIISPDDVNSFGGIESADPVVCSLILQPYNLTSMDVPSVANIPGAIQNGAQPSSYTGRVTFVVRNLGLEDLQPPWTLAISNDIYDSIEDGSVRHLAALTTLTGSIGPAELATLNVVFRQLTPCCPAHFVCSEQREPNDCNFCSFIWIDGHLSLGGS